MSHKHALLATLLAAGFITSASAHEITFAIGGLGSTMNAQQNYTNHANGDDYNTSGVDGSLGGEAALAYVWNVNSGFDMGFEIFYDYVGNLEVTEVNNAVTTINNVWGGRVLPGFKITNNTKIYVSLGYALIDQELSIKNADAISGEPVFSDTSISSTNQGGFQYGAGIETMIYERIGLRLAYTAQESPELKLESDNKTAFFTSTATVYDFFFGLTYHFQF
jgi:opacity protein-like surface antigen